MAIIQKKSDDPSIAQYKFMNDKRFDDKPRNLSEIRQQTSKGE